MTEEAPCLGPVGDQGSEGKGCILCPKDAEGGASRRRGWGLRATKGPGGVPIFAWVAAHGPMSSGLVHTISARDPGTGNPSPGRWAGVGIDSAGASPAPASARTQRPPATRGQMTHKLVAGQEGAAPILLPRAGSSPPTPMWEGAHTHQPHPRGSRDWRPALCPTPSLQGTEPRKL